MANPVTQNQQFFLGVNGEQTGPHTENEIVDRIRAGTVPADALVWFEGLQEWQSVQSIPAFGTAFSGGGASSPPPPASGGSSFKPLSESAKPAAGTANSVYKPSANYSNTDASTFSQGVAEPVFKVEKSLGSRFKPSKSMIALIVLAVLGAAGGAYYMFVIDAPVEVKAKVKVKAPEAPTREAELSKALSELILNPTASLDVVKGLIKANPDDEVGKQAITAAVDYYRLHSPPEAGRILITAKKPDEAVKYFLIDPPQYDEAEKAMASALDVVRDPVKKRKILLQDIDLLLGQLNQKALAVERIKLFEKDFPGEPNPYSYYLKSDDEKIRDLFNRISFYFVKNLLGVFESEMPQINLVSRPLIELRKGHDKLYRVVGVYKGDITLNHDHLNDINFQFWLDNEHWALVETNLTPERRKWAAGEKDRLKNSALPAKEMLRNLEALFHSQFPQNGLHENVNKPKAPVPE